MNSSKKENEKENEKTQRNRNSQMENNIRYGPQINEY